MSKRAETVYKLLNGIVCLYKPPNTSVMYMVKAIKNLICKELNNLKAREPHAYLEVERVGTDVSVFVRPSYADNVLCVGPRYQDRDVAVSVTTVLPNMASGVLGINGGSKMHDVLRSINLTRSYQVKGLFGEVHTDYKVSEKVLARATYDHVEKYHMERVLASFQASTQKRIIEEYGLDIESQEAYEFALKGLHRPANKGATIIYGLKVADFKPPDFTVEVQCIHETPDYFRNLIHNLGLNLKTFAACTGMRCIRHGCFHVEHTLLLQQCTLENILQNMKQCWEVLKESQGDVIRYKDTVDGDNSGNVPRDENQVGAVRSKIL